jgi:hypothetical protein
VPGQEVEDPPIEIEEQPFGFEWQSFGIEVVPIEFEEVSLEAADGRRRGFPRGRTAVVDDYESVLPESSLMRR